jgi:hypothetical protein
LVVLDVIALGLEILFTLVPFFYIAYLNIFFPPSKTFLRGWFSYSVGSYSLLYSLINNHDIIKVLGRATHQALILQRFESIGE